MKLNLALMALGGLEASKLYFGRDSCQWGPSYWCDSIEKAHQCGDSAIQFCINKTWGAPSAPTEVCETCKTAVGLAQMYLSDNKTRADVEDILSAACNVVPDEKLKMHCVDLIQHETEVVFDFIQKVMDPNVVCRGLQLCRDVADGDELVQAVKLGIENMPKAQVEIKPTEKVEQLAPILIDLELLKSPALFGYDVAQLRSETCELCKMAVAKVNEFISDPTNDGKVLDALEEMCDHLPSSYSDQCKAIIEMYGPQLIKLVEAQLAPQAICGALGLCSGYQKTLPARCQEEKKIGMCRALIKSVYFNAVTNTCESFNYGGCGGNNNRFDTVDQCNSQCVNALGLDVCGDCKLAITYLDSYLEDDANEQDIIKALEQVCDQVPASYKMECDDIIDTYGTEILKYADQIMDPKFICEKVGLCPAKKEMPLLGDSKCTYGPSYWCASRDNALECNAIEHCEKTLGIPLN
jgi:saposin